MRYELIVLSMIGIFVASLTAIFQNNVKKILAYSSVAQLGYMVLGVNLINAMGLSSAIVHMFNHAVIKAALFMVVGCMALRIGSVQLEDWRGAAKKMPWTCFAWALAGFGLIGVPLTAGFVSKWTLLLHWLAKRSGSLPLRWLSVRSSLLSMFGESWKCCILASLVKKLCKQRKLPFPCSFPPMDSLS
jgi:multicomponent Na+:H+ antiporter subunit D